MTSRKKSLLAQLSIDLRLKELPAEPWEITSILKCINKLSFLEVVDNDVIPQQFE
jgi:hypothetical protein